MNAKNLSLGLASLALLAITGIASADASLGQDTREEPVQDCIADTNGDGYVGFNDLVTVISTWGACPLGDGAAAGEAIACSADFTRDRRVDFHDLTILLLNYGQSCSTGPIQQ